MTYEEAMDSTTLVSITDAMRELDNHGVIGDELARFFVEVNTAYVDGQHLYKSREVLEWLGY